MSQLPSLLPIQPFTRPVSGELCIPGSKSLTNRALLLAALCRNPVSLEGALSSEDTELMVAALRLLGVQVEVQEDRLRISGQERLFSTGEADLFVGLAGTAARFLTALCAAAPTGVWRIDGVPQMRRRPMKGLIDALRQLGADIRCLQNEGFFPIEIHARGLRGGEVSIDATESSQLLSALLMVSPLAHKPVDITLVGGVRWPFVQMTARLMSHFGQPGLERLSEERFVVRNGVPYALPGGEYAIEPDATAASYFLALPIVAGGSLSLPKLRGPGGGLQGDTAFVDILRSGGMEIEERPGTLVTRFAKGSPLYAVQRDFSGFSDTFLTLAALAPLFKGSTRIEGIAHTRKQETDRVAGMVRELRRLGQQVDEESGAITIHPRPLVHGEEIETYHDHRFAMSFGILGSLDLAGDGSPWLSIRNPACCSKTFPHFFDLLAELRKRA